MSARFVTVLLWTFSVMLVAIGVAQIALTDNPVGGWGSIGVGISLIAVAASMREKSNG